MNISTSVLQAYHFRKIIVSLFLKTIDLVICPNFKNLLALHILLFLLLVFKSCQTLRPRGLQHTRLPCLSPSPTVYSHSRPLDQWCHPAIFSVVPFSSCPKSFPAPGSFPMSRFFASGGQSIGAPASASVLPMNIQGWFSLELTGLISLLSEGLSRIFSNIIVWKCEFFCAQPYLWSKSHICTWLLEKP